VLFRSPEVELGAAYDELIAVVWSLKALPAYSTTDDGTHPGFEGLINELKRIAEANYDAADYTPASYAAFDAAVESAWALINTPLYTYAPEQKRLVAAEVAKLKEAERALERNSIIKPKGKDVTTGVYAVESAVELVTQYIPEEHPDGVWASFDFEGVEFKNVGTAEFIVSYKDMAQIGDIELDNPNKDKYDATIGGYSSVLSGYKSYKIWIRAKSLETFSLADGDTLVTVNLKISDYKADILVPVIASHSNVVYYATPTPVYGEEITANAIEEPAYAEESFDFRSRFDVNHDDAVDIKDVEAVRNLLGAVKDASGKWFIGTTEVLAVQANRADLGSGGGPLSDPQDGKVDLEDLTLIKTAYETIYGF
jgi:hypothetical protein